MSVRRVTLPSTLALVVAACGGSTAAQSSTAPAGNFPAAATVNATPSIAFTPGNITLAVGGTVTFVFGGVAHNVFFDNDPAGAPAAIDGVNSNSSAQRTFNVAGTYNYFCHIHPGMRGTVVVGTATDTTTHSYP